MCNIYVIYVVYNNKINNNNVRYVLVHISRDTTITPYYTSPLLFHKTIVYYIHYSILYTL